MHIRQRIIACTVLLALAIPAMPVFAEPALTDIQHKVISLNNAGVTALNAEKIREAIDDFREALKLDPKYKLAKENIALAHNALGVQLRQKKLFTEALEHFHAALYANENNTSAEKNIIDTIEDLGLNPQRFEDRVKLADIARSKGDLVGAVIEYQAAVRLRNGYVPDGKGPQSDAQKPNQKPNKLISGVADIDFGPYMNELQKKIKRAWYPPQSAESRSSRVLFNIHKDGTMSDLKIDRSSGFANSDQAGLNAVKTAAPFLPLPKGSQDVVAIQFTFDYNAFLHESRTAEAAEANFEKTYLDAVQAKLEGTWLRPSLNQSQLVVLSFNLHKDGTVSELVLDEPAFPAANDAALAAVRKAVPFTTLPKTMPDSVSLQFFFAYNKDKFEVGGIQGVVGKLYGTGHANRFDQMDGWTHDLHERIKRSWIQTEGEKDSCASVVFAVDKSGKLSDLHILKSSGTSAMDGSALRAVQNSAPFPSPPTSAQRLDIELTFDKTLFDLPLYGVPSVKLKPAVSGDDDARGSGFRSPML